MRYVIQCDAMYLDINSHFISLLVEWIIDENIYSAGMSDDDNMCVVRNCWLPICGGSRFEAKNSGN